MVRYFILLILLFFSIEPISAQVINKISVHKVSQALVNGKKITTEADCYYNTQNYKFVTNVLKPQKFIKIINNKGELRIYFPAENRLILKQNSVFSSFNEDLHYFVNNLYDDLGLKNEGFKLVSTKFDNNYMISTWTPPGSLKKVSKVEVVYEKMIPIYSSYYDEKSSVIKKTYYSDYYQGSNLIMPQRITEISYTSKSDSLVRRTIYSNLKFNESVDDYYLNFKIPDNAKLAK